MTKETFALLSLAFVIALLIAAWFGWRSRVRRSRALPAPSAVPENLTVFGQASVLYVATTTATDHYDRIASYGLGFRGRGTVAVGERGIVLDLPSRAVFIPASDVVGVTRATWTIDRVVEPGGLVRILWRLGDATLATNVRVTGDDRELYELLTELAPDSGAATTEGSRA